MLAIAVQRAAAVSVLLAAATAFAQGSSNDDHPLDPYTPSWLRFGGQVRGRLELPQGSDALTGSADCYLLTRLRLNVTVRPLKWLTMFAETQDTRALGYGGTPPATMQDPLDLRAAYLELNSGGDRGIMVRAGRQEMAFGNSRVISIGPWSNTSKSFDVVRTALFRPGFRFELIAGSFVQVDGNRFDRHKPGEHFYTSYNTFSRLVPHSQVEPYFIAKTVKGVTGELGSRGNAVVYTGGLRWAGTFATRFDYSVEMLRQWGSWAADRIRADAGTYTFGWTFNDSPHKPRLSAEYSFGPGDGNPADGVRGALDLLYGNNQPFFSYTGMFSWRNLRTLRAGVDFNARKNVKVVLDYRDFYLATVADAWYNAAGNRIVLDRAATNRHVGAGPDTQLVWTAGRYGQVTVGIADVFAGAYMRQSVKGSGYLYPYLGWGRKF
ncbi:MAG TPA: alginate export family protein [Verrucomicrobiae bacterium]|nr:alginate export family protein [Verrucomicrobiae bacterium]